MPGILVTDSSAVRKYLTGKQIHQRYIFVEGWENFGLPPIRQNSRLFSMQAAVFDNGHIRIFSHSDVVVVEKYKSIEISGPVQKEICSTIETCFGLNKPAIIMRSASYSLSPEAIIHLTLFMQRYRGPVGYVANSQVALKVSNYAGDTYMHDSFVGVFPNLEEAITRLTAKTD
jgi:hypothetical protein